MNRTDAISEIMRLKAQYFRYMDTKHWPALRALFTDDCVFEGTRKPFKNPDEFVAALSEWLKDGTSVHHGFMPEIDLLSDTEAVAIWAMTDRVFFETPRMTYFTIENAYGFFGSGHYHDKYVCRNGKWLISSWGLTRMFVQPLTEKIICAAGTPSSIERLPVTL